MSKTLYLFVTSERPDSYVNAIAHCLIQTSVETITFVHISNVGQSAQADEPDLSAVALRNVQILMERLANGQYRYFVGENAGAVVDLAPMYTPEELVAMKQMYAQCLQKRTKWSHRQVPYGSLREELALANKADAESMFDVSSLSKSLLGDVVAVSILEGISSLYALELRQRPNFDEPWLMLLHELGTRPGRSGLKYGYVNIVNTPVFRKCSGSILVRGPRLIFPIALAFALLVAALTDYVIRGDVTKFIEVTSIASAVASLFSLFLNFFPARR